MERKTTKYERELAYQQEMIDAVRARTGKAEVLPSLTASPTTPIAPAAAPAPALKFGGAPVEKVKVEADASVPVPAPAAPAVAAPAPVAAPKPVAAPAAAPSYAAAPSAAAPAPAGGESRAAPVSCLVLHVRLLFAGIFRGHHGRPLRSIYQPHNDAP